MSIKNIQAIKSQKRLQGFNHIRNNRGFTLLEALIGFLVLSIGMLGIASLQALSLQAGKTSVYGSVAIMKVEEIFESMRATPGSLITYAGAGANNGCTVNVCGQATLAADNVFWWKENLTAGLPSTAGVTDVVTTIAVVAAVPPSKMANVAVTLSWAERDSDTTGSVTKTYTATSNICTANPC